MPQLHASNVARLSCSAIANAPGIPRATKRAPGPDTEGGRGSERASRDRQRDRGEETTRSRRTQRRGGRRQRRPGRSQRKGSRGERRPGPGEKAAEATANAPKAERNAIAAQQAADQAAANAAEAKRNATEAQSNARRARQLQLVAEANARRAEEERRRAEDNAILALSRQVAAQAQNNTETHYDLALLEAVEANRLRETPQARDSLLRILLAHPEVRMQLRPEQGDPWGGILVSPKGTTIAAATVMVAPSSGTPPPANCEPNCG